MLRGRSDMGTLADLTAKRSLSFASPSAYTCTFTCASPLPSPSGLSLYSSGAPLSAVTASAAQGLEYEVKAAYLYAELESAAGCAAGVMKGRPC